MKRSLLTPRWLLLHLVFVAAAVTTGLLAWWQWDRAHDAGGSFQNLGYALQWPLFGAFTLFLWYRLARMHLHEQRTEGGVDTTETAASTDASGPAGAETAETDATPRRKRPLVPPPAPPVDADEDPELAAYNQYLAELNETEPRR